MSTSHISYMHMPRMDMMPDLIAQNPCSHVNMPFMFNSYFNSFNTPQLHYGIGGMNYMYAP